MFSLNTEFNLQFKLFHSPITIQILVTNHSRCSVEIEFLRLLLNQLIRTLVKSQCIFRIQNILDIPLNSSLVGILNPNDKLLFQVSRQSQNSKNRFVQTIQIPNQIIPYILLFRGIRCNGR